MLTEKRPTCRFVLTGFSQEEGFRRFAFDSIGLDRTRTAFSVRADLALIRVYGIALQELPSLCRELLEQRADAELAGGLTFTEDDMRLHQAEKAAVAAQKKTTRRTPPPSGSARSSWRTAPPLVRPV